MALFPLALHAQIYQRLYFFICVIFFYILHISAHHGYFFLQNLKKNHLLPRVREEVSAVDVCTELMIGLLQVNRGQPEVSRSYLPQQPAHPRQRFQAHWRK